MTLSSAPLPQHIAIVMDGNSRWARALGMPSLMGHRQGSQVAQDIARCAKEMGVPFLSLYAFSSENWGRPQTEVEGLMDLLGHYLKNEVNQLEAHNIRLKIIGNHTKLSSDLLNLIKEAEIKTSPNTALTLCLAVSYGGRDEITEATRKIAHRLAGGSLSLQDIDENLFNQYLQTQGMPDVDLFIRTGGEKRLSNFLLWQSSYAELYFTDTLWPDFNVEEFNQAIDEFSQRNRRFGRVSTN